MAGQKVRPDGRPEPLRNLTDATFKYVGVGVVFDSYGRVAPTDVYGL
jgi:hypothetical protein